MRRQKSDGHEIFEKKTPILIVLFTLYTINKGPSKRVLKKNIFDTVL